LRLNPFELCLALMAFSGPALAAQVQVRNAWMRSLPGGLPAAGYFEMTNMGKNQVALTGAQSPLCGMLMLHKSSERGGMGRMEDVARVEIPAGGKIAFAPGGYHLMCMNPSSALRPGAKASVVLRFSDGTGVTVTFSVRNAMGK